MGRDNQKQHTQRGRDRDRSQSPAQSGERGRGKHHRSSSPVRDSVGHGEGQVVAKKSIDVGTRSVTLTKFSEGQLKSKDLIAFTQTAVEEARSFLQKTLDIGTLFGAADGFKRTALLAHQVAEKAQRKFVDCALEPVAKSEMSGPLDLANKDLAEKKADLDFWTAKQAELLMSHTALKAESDAVVRAIGPQPVFYGDYETTPPKSSKESREARQRAMKRP